MTRAFPRLLPLLVCSCLLLLLLAIAAGLAAGTKQPADPAGRGPATPDRGTPQAQLPDRGAAVLNVKDKPFGAVGDGITDDAPAINKALALARKTGEYGKGVQGTVVYVPPGVYRLDTPLDLNGGQFNLTGAGSYQTVLRGNTGDRAAVVELVGSGFCKLSGVLIDDLVDALPPAQRNPSAVGVLLARVDAPQNISDYAGPRFAAMSYYNDLEDVTIRLGTRPAANGGRGTCAYYNFGCEISGWHNCYFQADTAAVISSANPYGVRMKTVRDVEWRPGVPERMRMWAGETSMTVVRASGANSLIGITGPAALIAGASDVSMDSYLGHQAHLYLPGEPARWPRYAIEVTGVSHNLAHRGSIEGYPGALRVVGVPVSGLDLRAYLDVQTMYDAKGKEVDSVPVVMLDSRKVESPAGSGQFTVVGSALSDSHLAPAPTPNTANVVGRLIDTSADAAHVIQGNHLTLGSLKVRLRNAWPNSVLRGNVATSTRPLGTGQLQAPGGVTRGGNLVVSADGVETDGCVLPGAVPALPAPAAGHRGKMVRVEGGAGTHDRLFICEKDATGKYVWRQL